MPVVSPTPSILAGVCRPPQLPLSRPSRSLGPSTGGSPSASSIASSASQLLPDGSTITASASADNFFAGQGDDEAYYDVGKERRLSGRTSSDSVSSRGFSASSVGGSSVISRRVSGGSSVLIGSVVVDIGAGAGSGAGAGAGAGGAEAGFGAEFSGFAGLGGARARAGAGLGVAGGSFFFGKHGHRIQNRAAAPPAPPPRRNQQQIQAAQMLTALLSNARTVAELHELSRFHAGVLNAVHDSIICLACGRMGSSPTVPRHVRMAASALLSEAANRWLARVPGELGRGGRGVVNTLHGAAKLGFSVSDELVQALMREMAALSHEFDASQAANCLLSLALLGAREEEEVLVRPIAVACVELRNGFSASEATHSLWALATIGLADESLAGPLALAAVERIGIMTPRDVAANLWALARLGITDGPFVRPFAVACAERVVSMDAQDASNSLWALATVGEADRALVRPVAGACVAKVSFFSASVAAISLWSLAALGETDDWLVRPLTAACLNLLPFLKAHEAVNALWALATIGITDGVLLQPLAIACVELARDLTPQSASSCLWALATLGVTEASVVLPLAQAALSLACDMSAHEAAQCVWALAALGVGGELYARPFAVACVIRSEELGAREARQLLLAHFAGTVTHPTLLLRCWALAREQTQAPASRSEPHREAAAAAMARLGLEVRVAQPALGGLVSVSMVVRPASRSADAGAVSAASAASGAGAFSDAFVAVELDGPARFLQPPFGSPAGSIGPPKGSTRLRDALLRRRGSGFAGLVVFPFFEWESLRGELAHEDAYVAAKLRAEGLEWLLTASPAAGVSSSASGVDAGMDPGGAGAGVVAEAHCSEARATSAASATAAAVLPVAAPDAGPAEASQEVASAPPAAPAAASTLSVDTAEFVPRAIVIVAQQGAGPVVPLSSSC